MAMVANWMHSGVIQDPYSEFFIQRLDNLRVKQQDDLKIDWDNEFSLRFWVDKANKECNIEPKILKGKAQKILDAGKSVRLSLYLRSNPQNSEVTKLVLEKPNVHKTIVDQLDVHLQEHFGSLPDLQASQPKYRQRFRPSFNLAIKNELYSAKSAKKFSNENGPKGRWAEPRQVQIDNELEQMPRLPVARIQESPSLFGNLISSSQGNLIHPFQKKKYTMEIEETAKLDESEDLLSQVAKKVSQLVEHGSTSPLAGFILHKTLREAFATSFSLTSNVIASNLGSLLHTSFDISKIMKTVRYCLMTLERSIS